MLIDGRNGRIDAVNAPFPWHRNVPAWYSARSPVKVKSSIWVFPANILTLGNPPRK